MASEAVIHFFGLVVATTQVLSGEQTEKVSTQVNSVRKTEVVMIMPDIAKLNSRGTLARTTQKTITSNTPSQIEPHTALIIFAANDLLSSRGFDINRLSDDYLTIELKGDVISFFAEGETRSNFDYQQKLAGLGGTLLEDFWPPAYPGAAAVFKIPNGEFKTCTSGAEGTEGRVDNELHLKNSGEVIINSGAKSLTLRGDADVYAGNAPMGYVVAHGKASHKMAEFKPHYFAYCWMIGKPDEDCLPPQPKAGSDPCDKNQQRSMTTKPKPPVLFAITNWECSNTQWP